METKQIQIYKLHKDMLKDYAENEKYMFLYVTDKVKEEYKNIDMIYNFGEEIYKVKYIQHMQYNDHLIYFLQPEIIYYKDDYEQERKFDYIKVIKFKVEKLEEE